MPVHDSRGGQEAAAKSLLLSASETVLNLAAPPAGTVLRQIVGAAQAKRLAAWTSELDSRMRALQQEMEKQGVTLQVHEDKLSDAYMMAMQAALMVSDDWMLKRLQNVVLNSVRGDVEGETRELALTMLARMSPLHLRVLRFVVNPPRVIREHGAEYKWGRGSGSLRSPMRETWPDYARLEHAITTVLADLQSMGLTESRDLGGMSYWAGNDGKPIVDHAETPIGAAVVRLVENPLPA